MVTPICLGVCKLITNPKFIGYCTGSRRNAVLCDKIKIACSTLDALPGHTEPSCQSAAICQSVPGIPPTKREDWMAKPFISQTATAPTRKVASRPRKGM
jgi:hypothetical protein